MSKVKESKVKYEGYLGIIINACCDDACELQTILLTAKVRKVRKVFLNT